MKCTYIILSHNLFLNELAALAGTSETFRVIPFTGELKNGANSAPHQCRKISAVLVPRQCPQGTWADLLFIMKGNPCISGEPPAQATAISALNCRSS